MASQFIIDDVDNPLKTTSSNPMGSADFKKVPSNFTAEELDSYKKMIKSHSIPVGINVFDLFTKS